MTTFDALKKAVDALNGPMEFHPRQIIITEEVLNIIMSDIHGQQREIEKLKSKLAISKSIARHYRKNAIAMLTEDYRSWLMDMFHKYDRDDLAALLVRYGEEDLLATVLKEQAVKPKSKSRHGETCQYQHWCGNCMAMLHGKPKFCPNCGKAVKWE